MFVIYKGVVVNYDENRGFGFVKQKDSKDNFYFHIHGRNEVSLNYYLGNFVHNLRKNEQLKERIPKIGEELAYKLKIGMKENLIARYWCFGDEFDEVTKQIKKNIQIIENSEWRLVSIYEYPSKDMAIAIDWQGDNPFDCPIDIFDPETDNCQTRSYPEFCITHQWKSKSKTIFNSDWQECDYPSFSK